MIDWTFLLLIPSVLAVVWFLPHASTRRQYSFEQFSQDQDYTAVSIQLCQHACNAAQAISGKRILASEAFALPLPQCNSATCGCHYVHHEDRRTGIDRRLIKSKFESDNRYLNKRSGIDRRKNAFAY